MANDAIIPVGNGVYLFRLELTPGWNLIGFPFIPCKADKSAPDSWDDIFLTEDLQPVSESLGHIMRYEKEISSYVTASGPADYGTAYWWYIRSSVNYYVRGMMFSAGQIVLRYTLKSWHFITPLGPYSNLSELVAQGDLNFNVWGYKKSQNKFVKVEVSDMQLYKGYWLYISPANNATTQKTIDVVYSQYDLSSNGQQSDSPIQKSNNIDSFLYLSANVLDISGFNNSLLNPTLLEEEDITQNHFETVKSPLVSKWSDSIHNVLNDDNALCSTALTAKAVWDYINELIDEFQRYLYNIFPLLQNLNNVFSANDILFSDTNTGIFYDILEVNIDKSRDPGVYRIYDYRKHPYINIDDLDSGSPYNGKLIGTFPPIPDYTGYLTILELSKELPSVNPDYGKIKIRQILYPDDPSNQAPWTRVGYSDEQSGELVWSNWSMMGGGLRRIFMTASVGGSGQDPVALNTIYESFNNYQLTLPDPRDVATGTKIGLEQYGGIGHQSIQSYTGKVIFDEYEQVTTPEIATIDGVQKCTGTGVLYLFECCDIEVDGVVSHEWVMDTTHDDSRTISDLISNLATIRNSMGRKLNYINYTDSLTLVCDSSPSALSNTTNIYWYDIHLIFGSSVTGTKTIYLPKANNIPNGAKIEFDLVSGVDALTVSVKSDDNDDDNTQQDDLVRRGNISVLYTFIYRNGVWNRVVIK